jgi:hypothetical protein
MEMEIFAIDMVVQYVQRATVSNEILAIATRR